MVGAEAPTGAVGRGFIAASPKNPPNCEEHPVSQRETLRPGEALDHAAAEWQNQDPAPFSGSLAPTGLEKVAGGEGVTPITRLCLRFKPRHRRGPAPGRVAGWWSRVPPPGNHATLGRGRKQWEREAGRGGHEVTQGPRDSGLRKRTLVPHVRTQASGAPSFTQSGPAALPRPGRGREKTRRGPGCRRENVEAFY